MIDQVVAELVEMRVGLDLTQADVAREMGTVQSHVSNIERLATEPKLSTLVKYAHVLGLLIEVSVVEPPEED